MQVVPRLRTTLGQVAEPRRVAQPLEQIGFAEVRIIPPQINDAPSAE